MLSETEIEAIGMMIDDTTPTAVDLLRDEMTEETGRARQNVDDTMTQGTLETIEGTMIDESEATQEIDHLTTAAMTVIIEEGGLRKGLMTGKTMAILNGESET